MARVPQPGDLVLSLEDIWGTGWTLARGSVVAACEDVVTEVPEIFIADPASRGDVVRGRARFYMALARHPLYSERLEGVA